MILSTRHTDDINLPHLDHVARRPPLIRHFTTLSSQRDREMRDVYFEKRWTIVRCSFVVHSLSVPSICNRTLSDLSVYTACIILNVIFECLQGGLILCTTNFEIHFTRLLCIVHYIGEIRFTFQRETLDLWTSILFSRV